MKWIYNIENNTATLAIDSVASDLSIPYNNENFIKPVVFDGQIIEGATEQEIAEMENAEIVNTLINFFFIFLNFKFLFTFLFNIWLAPILLYIFTVWGVAITCFINIKVWWKPIKLSP